MKKLLILLFLNQFSFSQISDDRPLILKKTVALEICSKNIFNPCSDYDAVKFSKIPEFVNLDKRFSIVKYDTIYKMPPLEIQLKYVEDFFTLSDYFNLPIASDTIDLCVSRTLKNKIRKNFKNNSYNLQPFNGCYKYLIYDVEFECLYGGKGKTYVPSRTGSEAIIEKEVHIYYVINVIELKPRLYK